MAQRQQACAVEEEPNSACGLLGCTAHATLLHGCQTTAHACSVVDARSTHLPAGLVSDLLHAVGVTLFRLRAN